MKKRSKERKSKLKINRNFFIFQGVMIALISYLAWGSWIKFFIFVVLEIAAYSSFVNFFLKKHSRQKFKKKSLHSKEVYKNVRSNTRELTGLRESKASNRIGRKNFNWEISSQTQNELDKNLETSDKVSSGLSYVNESHKSVLQEQTKKFVPYRSPFDPIKPREEKKEEAGKETQLSLDNESNIQKNISEPEGNNNKIEAEYVKIEVEHKEYNEEVKEVDKEEVREEFKEFSEEVREEGNNKEVELGEKDASLHAGIDSIIEEIMVNNNPRIQMEYDDEDDIIQPEAQNKINLYEDNKADSNTYVIKTEELSCNVEDFPVSVYQVNPGVFPSKKHYEEKMYNEDNKAVFDQKKTITSTNVEGKESVDLKPVQSVKTLLDSAEYKPPIELLRKNEVTNYDEEIETYIEYNSFKLIDTLASFGVGARVLNVSKGPTVTRYELQPNAGVKVSKIINLSDDIALNLAATGVRIEAPIPGKAAVGIEIPNKKNVPVYLRDVIEEKTFLNHPSKLAFAVGKDIAGNVVVGDITKMPHLLIAGATGSGKSVCINTLIVSILYKASPAEVRLLMVDPKVVELGIYNGVPHLLIPVVTEPKKAAGALNWAVTEMTTRYRLFAENNVRDLNGYNEMIKERGEGETLPHIVIIIDELADLMMVAPNEVEDSICRLAQMARAAGMHLVIATQRPSVNVITGVIKANIPSRISFAVSSQIDSRTILDMAGAEKLLGRGDMLFYPLGQPKPLRVQGSFISDKEVDKIVTHIKLLQSAEYDEEILQKIDNQTETPKPDSSGDDELLPQAIATVLELGQASASLIQRKFKVGYSRAARILDQMESWGVVSASDGSSKPRQILITKQEWEELNA